MKGRPNRQAVGNAVSALAVHHDHVRAELTPINHTGVVSALVSLSSRQQTEGQLASPPSLIEDSLPLPGRFLLSDPSRIAGMHQKDGLSALAIARRLSVSHSAVLEALGKLGITTAGNAGRFKGQVPFGCDFRDAHLVRSNGVQQVIRLVRQLRVRAFPFTGSRAS